MIVVGTGHRPEKLGGPGYGALMTLTEIAAEWLSGRKNVEKVISGMARGWDTALALAALNNGIPLVCAVPFDGQASVWSRQDQKLHEEILKLAAEVKIVSSGSGYGYRVMQRRNVWMVDQLRPGTDDTLLAMHDGTFGGTYNCLEYARSKKTPPNIINLYSQWLKTGLAE